MMDEDIIVIGYWSDLGNFISKILKIYLFCNN